MDENKACNNTIAINDSKAYHGNLKLRRYFIVHVKECIVYVVPWHTYYQYCLALFTAYDNLILRRHSLLSKRISLQHASLILHIQIYM